MLFHLKILLESRNLSLQKWLHRRLGLICQQSYPAIKDVNYSRYNEELCNKKTFHLWFLFKEADYEIWEDNLSIFLFKKALFNQ